MKKEREPKNKYARIRHSSFSSFFSIRRVRMKVYCDILSNVVTNVVSTPTLSAAC